MLRQVWAIMKKDIVLELRTKEMLISMFLFVLLTMIIFNYAFDAQKTNLTVFGGGLLWLAFTFTSLLGLNRSFAHEKDEGCLEGLLLAPIDRSLVFVAKMASNLLFLGIIEVAAVPIFSVFFINRNWLPTLPLFLIGLVLGNIGIAAVGTFLATLAVNTRHSDLLVPILALPIFLPALAPAVIIGGSALAGTAGQGSTAELVRSSILILVAYDIVFVVVAAMLYDFVLGE